MFLPSSLSFEAVVVFKTRFLTASVFEDFKGEFELTLLLMSMCVNFFICSLVFLKLDAMF